MIHFLIMLAFIVSAIWTPHLVGIGVQRVRYYCRSHGITQTEKSGEFSRENFRL